MALLDDMRSELRVSTTAFDGEIQNIISASIVDLEQSGITASLTDPLMKMSVALYVKAYFGWDNPESPKFVEAYEKLRNKMAVASDYNAFKVTFTVTKDGDVVDEALIVINNENHYTNSKGVYVHYVYSVQDIGYTVVYGSDSTTGSVYVDGSESVAVEL